MFQTLYNGYSGVKSYQKGVDSISNNIANINTNGFKADEIRFESVFSQAVDSVNANSPVANTKSYGVTVAENKFSTAMGSFINADDSDFNMALGSDKGWFKVGDRSGIYYTREGAFGKDANGDIVNSSGMYLYGVDLGKISNGAITPTGKAGSDISTLASATSTTKLNIPEDLRYPAQKTTYVNSVINLAINEMCPTKNLETDSDFLNRDISTIYSKDYDKLSFTGDEKIVFNQIDTTTGEKTPVEVSLSGTKSVQDLLDKFKENGVDVSIEDSKFIFKNNSEFAIDLDTKNSSKPLLDALGLDFSQSLTTGNSIESKVMKIPSTTLQNEIFNSQGEKSYLKPTYTLYSKKGTQEVWKIDAKADGETTTAYLSFDKNKPTLYSDVGLSSQIDSMQVAFGDGIIDYNPVKFTDEFGNAYEATNVYSYSENFRTETDGVAAGTLSNVGIDENGIISLQFNNNKAEVYGRVGIVNFMNNNGLSKVGGTVFEETENSGKEVLNWNSEGRLNSTSIVQHKLETSNVAMESALTNLIIMQRAYSASTKSISTADEMIKEAIGLKN